MVTKHALITGGSRGIGAASVKLFVASGYRVTFFYNHSENEAQKLVDALSENVRAVKCDVSVIDEVKTAVAGAESIQPIDVLVNNAGVSVCGLFHEITENNLQILYGVNLFGTLNCCRAVIPNMINRKSGAIVNVASIWGEVGGSNEVDYSVTKAAVIGLTKALAKELAPSDIRVNCVSPGVVDTDMNSELSYDDLCSLKNAIPLERFGEPEELARAILFLATEESSYITGQVLSVGGGFGK